MKKKKRINKKKFLSRIVLLFFILFLIIFSINCIFNKGKKTSNALSLVLNKQDITDKLSYDIYIDKDKTLYMSMDDIKKVFDKNLYYENETNKIITTSKTKVGAIDLSNNIVKLNSASLSLAPGVIDYGYTKYLPISELTNIYNIEVTTSENSAVVASLYEELITIKTTKKVSLKERTTAFSSTVQKLNQGEELIFIEDSNEKGWVKVLTYEGKFGYVKEKDLSEKEQKRAKMEETDFTSKTPDKENALEIGKSTITSEKIDKFSDREKIVEDIIGQVISKEKFTVNINLKDIDVPKEKIERFIIEIIPRLKEIGGSVIVTNNSILDSEFIKEFNLEI